SMPSHIGTPFSGHSEIKCPLPDRPRTVWLPALPELRPAGPTMATRTHYPPGPYDRLCGLSYYGPLRANPLAFVERVARAYGDFAFVRVGWVQLYLVNRPNLIREVLTSKASSFRKLGRQMRALR